MARNPALSETKRTEVIVVDPMEIRRSGIIISLLAKWAESESLQLDPVDLESALSALEHQESIRLIILSTGGVSIVDREMDASIQKLRTAAPDIPLIILSDRSGPDEVVAAIAAGAMGYFHTGCALELAMNALSFIAKGGSYFPVCALRDLQFLPANQVGPIGNGAGVMAHAGLVVRADELKKAAGDHQEIAWSLTPRQTAVLECLRQGDSNKLIAKRLSVSETTVKVHVRQIMRKLGVANRTQAAVICSGQPAAA